MRRNTFNYDIFHNDPLIQKKIIDKSNFTYREIIRIVDKYLKGKSKILDIGCGVGTIDFYLASKKKRVWGVDISQNAILMCKKSAKYLNLENRTTFMSLEFPTKKIKLSEKVDSVIMFEVIEHLNDDELALKAIFNLLEKNGLLILSTPSKNAPLMRMGLLDKFDKKVGHIRRYSIDELVKKCNEIGFELICVEETEGIIRNFLFTNRGAGKLIRFVRYFIADIVTYVDNLSLKMWGASDIFLVLKKS